MLEEVCDVFYYDTALTLSHLSAHVVNRLLRENRKSIPQQKLMVKTFKNCNPNDFKFYLVKSNNKKMPIWYGTMLILCLFSQ